MSRRINHHEWTHDQYSHDPSMTIPFTIEAQLQAYSSENDRYELLWHAWKQNKRWLVKLLDLAFSSFPGYSNHDASHADTVLHNIERILGEERIRSLSASDSFMLLHTAYVHDIGMCITATDRKNAIKDSQFNKMLDKFEQSSDPAVQNCARALRRTSYEPLPDRESANYQEKCRGLNEEKLQVYYALTYALAEYHRSNHGDKAKRRLEELIENPDKLGGGFSMSGVPMRIFLSIAACAGLHTTWGFAPILELPWEDSGYALDQIHPRFVAVMLQLGDALDLDNDRFHPLMLDYVGNMSRTSQLHYDKHKAIRCLQITPSEIFIEASCPDQEVLHLVRQSCDCVEALLKEASYHWAEIVPPEVHGCLPTMLPPTLLINGKNIPKELVSCRFNISQERAFRLLEGSNLYGSEFAFLRELLQNSLDATKLQCWRDYQNSLSWQDGAEAAQENELELLRYLETWRYPVEIVLTVAAMQESDGAILRTPGEVKAADERQEHYTYGVWLELRDSGVGITQKDLDSISKVGTSHERKEDDILQMPASLRPTGKFGIGLQSVFMVNNRFSCRTRARNEETYHITFTSATGGRDGYINVEPIDERAAIPYGSTFEVFIPYYKKSDDRDYLNIWSGEDPFDATDRRDLPLMSAEDLQAQLISYVDDILGERLFPICVRANNGFSSVERHGLKESPQDSCASEASSQDSHQPRQLLYTRNSCKKWSAEEKRANLCWGLHDKAQLCWGPQGEDSMSYSLEGGDVYWFDLKNCKFYVWSAQKKVFACLGAARFLNAPDLQESSEPENIRLSPKGIGVFYKGMRLSISSTTDNDMELLEYVDIKDAPTGKILQLNRDEMTKEGEEYLREEIYPAVMDTASRALHDFAKRDLVKNGKRDLASKVKELFFPSKDRLLSAGSSRSIAEIEHRSARMVSLILLAYFAKTTVQARTRLPACALTQSSFSLTQDKCIWEELLQQCADWLEEDKVNLDPPRWNRELLWVRTFEDTEDIRRDVDQDWRTIADVLSNRAKYAVLSMRESTRHEWKHSLCRVEVTRADNSIRGIDYRNIPEVLERSRGKILYEKFTDYFARWMLHHIPTAESYTYLSDETMPGNIRINLLTREPVNEVFLNDDMKYLLLKKAAKRYQTFRASRFSTLAWEGFGCLVMQDIRTDVCQVDCGFATSMCHPNMILPILGSDLDRILRFGALSDDVTKRFWKQVQRIEEIILQWDSVEHGITSLKEERATAFEREHRIQLDSMTLDEFFAQEFYDLESDIRERIEAWLDENFYVDTDSSSDMDGFFDTLGEDGKQCWEDYVKAAVLSSYAKDIYIRTAFAPEKKEQLIKELWDDRPVKQKGLLEELQHKGKHALPQEIADRLYRALIDKMLGCVQTLAQHSFEKKQRNIYYDFVSM